MVSLENYFLQKSNVTAEWWMTWQKLAEVDLDCNNSWNFNMSWNISRKRNKGQKKLKDVKSTKKHKNAKRKVNETKKIKKLHIETKRQSNKQKEKKTT